MRLVSSCMTGIAEDRTDGPSAAPNVCAARIKRTAEPERSLLAIAPITNGVTKFQSNMNRLTSTLNPIVLVDLNIISRVKHCTAIQM